ncbi:MAG: Crp/Fnr family transcriptional regulator [Crocinitomicaceae bacterium]
MDLTEKIRNVVSQMEMLNKDEVEIIIDKTIADSFKKGTVLLREGQIPKKCYMVVEGCVREYILKDGEDISTGFFVEGDTFTPNSQKSEPSKYYWECLEDCVLTISDKNFEEEIRAALPRLDAVFQEIAIQKINKSKEELSQFMSSSPEERYLNLLETKPHLINRVSQHQIASYLGIKPQSLSRIRKRLISKK